MVGPGFGKGCARVNPAQGLPRGKRICTSWRSGTLAFWYCALLAYCLAVWRSGVGCWPFLNYWCSGAGVLALPFWRSSVPVLAVWRSDAGGLTVWRSGVLAFWRSGVLAFWRWRDDGLAFWMYMYAGANMREISVVWRWRSGVSGIFVLCLSVCFVCFSYWRFRNVSWR